VTLFGSFLREWLLLDDFLCPLKDRTDPPDGLSIRYITQLLLTVPQTCPALKVTRKFAEMASLSGKVNGIFNFYFFYFADFTSSVVQLPAVNRLPLKSSTKDLSCPSPHVFSRFFKFLTSSFAYAEFVALCCLSVVDGSNILLMELQVLSIAIRTFEINLQFLLFRYFS
jgi:hypothetical protein